MGRMVKKKKRHSYREGEIVPREESLQRRKLRKRHHHTSETFYMRHRLQDKINEISVCNSRHGLLLRN